MIDRIRYTMVGACDVCHVQPGMACTHGNVRREDWPLGVCAFSLGRYIRGECGRVCGQCMPWT